MQWEEIAWLEPWQLIESSIAARLEPQLQREVGPGHPLYGVTTTALARRWDNVDVLFASSAGPQPLAVVHLTWSTFPAGAPTQFPWTTFYPSLETWVDQCMKLDNKEWHTG